jgi:hypothetical protein
MVKFYLVLVHFNHRAKSFISFPVVDLKTMSIVSYMPADHPVLGYVESWGIRDF